MKLGAIAAAVAMISACSGAYAMESLDDDAMSDATGQAGLTITTTLGTGVGGIFDYTDTNGKTGTGATAGGFFTNNTQSAELLAGFSLSGKIVSTVDVGALTAGNADLFIDTQSTNFTTTLNWLGVCSDANSTNGQCNGTGTASTAPTASTTTFEPILGLPSTGVQVSLANFDAQIILGSASTTQHFMTITLPSTFSLTLGTGGTTPQFSLLDGNNYTSGATEGGIGMSQLTVTPTGALTTTVDACNGSGVATTFCSATAPAGLQVTVAANSTFNIVATNVVLGNVGSTSTTSSIGNVALYSFNAGGTTGTTINIAGH